jgi:hypothetical protein
MSRVLPARPNLEFLKNEAKDLLQTLRRETPGARLADALHRLARDYGFQTWPALKAHVESLAESADIRTAAAAISPLAGTWCLDVHRSRLNAHDDVRDATIEIAITGAAIEMTHRQRDSAGRSDEATSIFVADDQPHPAGDGYLLRARWRDGRALETVAIHDGAIVGQGVYEVSHDGRTLTISSTDAHANSRGWQMADHVLVLDRQ